MLLVLFVLVFFFKQKTAYEMRISDWSSDVCSSDLRLRFPSAAVDQGVVGPQLHLAGLLLDEGDEADRIGEGVVVEGHGDRLGEIGRASCRERVCQYV